MDRSNRSGGLFERYVIDGNHVSATAWIFAFAWVITLTPVGLFYLGALTVSCIHRRPARPVEERRGGWRVLIRVTLIVIGFFVLLVAIWISYGIV